MKNLPARIFAWLCLAMIMLAWTYTFGLISPMTLSLTLRCILLFASATLFSVLIFRAPAWLLATLILLGVFAVVAGSYFLIEEPEGILTPALIPLGAGMILAVGTIQLYRRASKTR